MQKLLIEEPPLQILPTLAIAIGLNEAIVLQQLHYLLREPRFGRRIAEQQWIFNTYEQWRAQYFPFWSEATIQRTFANLAKRRLVLSCQPEGGISRRKYYRIAYDTLEALACHCTLESSSSQFATFDVSKSPLPITKTTAKTTNKESKETANEFAADDLSAKWKPVPGTKKEKLSRIKPPSDYPTEREFDAFLDTQDLGGIVNYRPDLYSTLCENKWHRWDDHLEKWCPIRDWRKFVAALDQLIAPQ
jgi:hypothetical protein